jgi:hypothetical protein
MAVLCRVEDGMLFVDFETHDFPDGDLRKVKHHIDCHLREAIEEAEAEAEPIERGGAEHGEQGETTEAVSDCGADQ